MGGEDILMEEGTLYWPYTTQLSVGEGLNVATNDK